MQPPSEGPRLSFLFPFLGMSANRLATSWCDNRMLRIFNLALPVTVGIANWFSRVAEGFINQLMFPRGKTEVSKSMSETNNVYGA